MGSSLILTNPTTWVSIFYILTFGGLIIAVLLGTAFATLLIYGDYLRRVSPMNSKLLRGLIAAMSFLLLSASATLVYITLETVTKVSSLPHECRFNER
jgi:hypothetical protein